MNKYTHIAGALAVALALGVLPAAAFADTGEGSGGGVQVQAQAQVQAQVGEGDAGIQQRQQEAVREQERQTLEASSSESIKGAEEMGEAQGEREMEREGVPFRLESTTTPAFSLAQLQQSIAVRKQELEQEVANATSSADKALVANANPVRLAVHALLASKDMVGGIGAQVSQIAQQMNDSVASTTVAEAQIQSRGFLTKLFFGGDSSAAQVINQAVAKNQAHIQTLTDLLSQANISADVKATLTAQITALQDAQTKLQALAQQQQSMWGLFSWRF
ncbi:MAG TPA: hypothetical protein PLW99_02575 [Candidatus Paceibacterota bacterium]|nr:MAG: hypothetical protein B7X03_03650 [Parcubacteria group bacterium 21-58-10]HQT83007.1 hypothetical protein [Candidatus Paceibacterota bacterium]